MGRGKMSTIDITALYNLYYKRIYQISYRIIKDTYLAEDIVQETFIKAIKHAHLIEEESKTGAWLAVIATRTAIDFVRKEKNKKWLPMDQEMLDFIGTEMKQDVEEEVLLTLLTEHLNDAIDKLTFNYQAVLLLRIKSGYKEQEIAQILNIKEGAVKTRIFRARKQLKPIFYRESV